MGEVNGRSGERFEVPSSPLASRSAAMLGGLWSWFLVRGLLAAALGLAVLARPSESLSALARLVGVYCLLDGAANLAAVVRGARSGTTWASALGGVTAGAVLLFWPAVPLRAFLLLFGGWAILVGATHVLFPRSRGEATSTVTLGWLLAGLGLILLLWPGIGVVAIAWVIALAALLIAVVLLYIASRLRFLQGCVTRDA